MYEGAFMEDRQWTPIPTWLRKSSAQDRDIRLWLYLCERGGETHVAFPAHRTCAREIKCSVKQVRTSLSRLEGLGALDIVPWTWEGGDQTSNTYIIWPAKPSDFSVEEITDIREGGTLRRSAIAAGVS